MKKAAKMQAIQDMMDMLVNEHGFLDPIGDEKPEEKDEEEHGEDCECPKCVAMREEGDEVADDDGKEKEDAPEAVMSLIRLASAEPKKNRYDDAEEPKGKKPFGKSRYNRV